MPSVRIEVVDGWTPAEKKGALDAVHSALVEAFEIPHDDRTQRVVEHRRDGSEVPPGRSERYTLVEITAFAGRSPSAELGNWGIRGGQPADQVDLGFQVDI